MAHVVDHPLVQHKLSLMRQESTPTMQFRSLLAEVAMLIVYEATRDLPLTTRSITTPLQTFDAPVLKGKKLVLVSILRAGNGFLDGMLRVLPSARVGHVGMARDETTHLPSEYYFKMPPDMEAREVIVVDPMLATGNSAIAAIARVKRTQPKSIKFVCLVAAPEGVAALEAAHPDVTIYTASIDSHLNENAYIVPGLGDAGDRIYGTC
jgi:uracil phosphoribosyltransferase